MDITKEDIARLLADPSVQTRADLATKIGNNLDSPLTENELKLAQDIVRHMAKDIAVQVRMSLALSVKKSSHLPHDVALTLAKDVEQVALPVLEFSNILNEADLMDIVRNAHPDERQMRIKQEAIARRDHVSSKVSAVIVETGTEKAVITLLNNKTAQIAEESLLLVSERCADNEALQESLVHRPTLPLTVAERLVAKVSDNLRHHLATHHNLSANFVSDIIIQAREKATVSLLTPTRKSEDVEKLVEQLVGGGVLTPSLILRTLCLGDTAFFEYSMAGLAGIPIVNARTLIYNAGALGLKSLYDKTGLAAGMFPIIRVALEVISELKLDGGSRDTQRYSARIIERILTQHDDFDPQDVHFLLNKLSDLVDPS